MNNTWSKKWKTVLIWFSAYFSFTTLALVGGYAILKEEEDLKKTAKQAFIITLVFTAISAFLSIFNSIMGFGDYNANAYDFYNTCNRLLSIAKIIVYAVFIIMALAKKEEAPKQEQQKEQNDEQA